RRTSRSSTTSRRFTRWRSDTLRRRSTVTRRRAPGRTATSDGASDSEEEIMSTATARRTVLRSDELTCPSCIAKIERALAVVPGVERAEVRFNSGKIDVLHHPEHAPADTLVDVVPHAGYVSRMIAF